MTFERIRLPLSEGDRIDHLLTHVEIFCEGGRYQRDDLLKAGLSMHDYVVTAAISMAAIGLSPGAEVLEVVRLTGRPVRKREAGSRPSYF